MKVIAIKDGEVEVIENASRIEDVGGGVVEVGFEGVDADELICIPGDDDGDGDEEESAVPDDDGDE